MTGEEEVQLEGDLMQRASERIAFNYGRRLAKAGRSRTLPPLDLLVVPVDGVPLEASARIDKAWQMGYDSEPEREKKQ